MASNGRSASGPLAARSRVSASWWLDTGSRSIGQCWVSSVRRWRSRGSAQMNSTRRGASAATACRSPATLNSGISIQNVEPAPGRDCTPMRPCIRSTMRLQMVRPRPVPPYRRVVDASAWVKAWNSRACCCSSMPMPVSRTSKRSWWLFPFSPRRCTLTSTPPRAVNLMALEIRLPSTCRRRTGSPRTASRTAGSSSSSSRRPFSWALRRSSCTMPSSSSRRLKLVISSSTLSASSLE